MTRRLALCVLLLALPACSDPVVPEVSIAPAAPPSTDDLIVSIAPSLLVLAPGDFVTMSVAVVGGEAGEPIDFECLASGEAVTARREGAGCMITGVVYDARAIVGVRATQGNRVGFGKARVLVF